jgi:HEAT repeat protein
VRELAIRRLDEFSTGEELRFLLVRLNDWVDPVRELAHELVLKRLVPAYRDVIFNYLGLILRLKNCARIQQGAILAASVELFCHAEGRAYLSAIATSRDRQVRLGFLKAAVDLENESRIGFARQLLDDPDPHVQFVASRVVLAECYPEELPELTAKLLRSKSPRVRREALQTVVSRVPDLAPQKLLESLVDGNTGVRALALFYLSANSGFNAAQFFRDRLDLASGIQRVGAILGLGETGVARDADAIRILLNAKESKLRKAAVCALGRLRPPGIEADLLLMLGDRSAAVSKQAYNGLLRRNQRDHLEELLGIFEGSEFEHVRLNALKLILLGDKWTVLPFLILNSCGETKIADCANAFLRAWLGSSTRGYYSPSRAQIDLAKESLNSVRGRIQKCIARELDIFLNEIETR